jgi:hypothetical protein
MHKSVRLTKAFVLFFRKLMHKRIENVQTLVK